MDHFNFDNISHDFSQFGNSFNDILNNLIHNVSFDVHNSLNQTNTTQYFDQHLFDQQHLNTFQPYDKSIYNNVPTCGSMDFNK